MDYPRETARSESVDGISRVERIRLRVNQAYASKTSTSRASPTARCHWG